MLRLLSLLPMWFCHMQLFPQLHRPGFSILFSAHLVGGYFSVLYLQICLLISDTVKHSAQVWHVTCLQRKIMVAQIIRLPGPSSIPHSAINLYNFFSTVKLSLWKLSNSFRKGPKAVWAAPAYGSCLAFYVITVFRC